MTGGGCERATESSGSPFPPSLVRGGVEMGRCDWISAGNFRTSPLQDQGKRVFFSLEGGGREVSVLDSGSVGQGVSEACRLGESGSILGPLHWEEKFECRMETTSRYENRSRWTVVTEVW